MAVSFLELERRIPIIGDDVVNSNGVLVFDTIVSSEGLGTQIGYDMATGIITFLEPGYYYVDWYVAPYYGLTTNGSNWAIKTSVGNKSYIGSSHTKVSVTTGFAIINAGPTAIETARLVNVSDGAIYLSKAVLSRAGLIVYEIAVFTLAGN